jgi:hypothetical protein
VTDLEQALRDYDGRSVTTLSETRARFGNQQGFLRELCAFIRSQEAFISDGATWLIKDCAEDGMPIGANEVAAMLEGLDLVSSWPAALHLCQTVKYLPFTPVQAHRFAIWATPLLEHDRPFLRAWAMDAIQHLATRSTDLTPLAERALAGAKEDEAASVRARAKAHERRIR